MLFALVLDVCDVIDKGNTSVLILFGFLAAFDPINHGLLLFGLGCGAPFSDGLGPFWRLGHRR